MDKNDKNKNGLYEYFFDGEYSHQIKWRGEYKDGLKHGFVEAFHWRNGNLVRREFWEEGKEEGTWEQFDKDTGKLTSRAIFANGEQKNAEWFFENGKVEIRGDFKKNVQDGEWEYFYEDAELKKPDGT